MMRPSRAQTQLVINGLPSGEPAADEPPTVVAHAAPTARQVRPVGRKGPEASVDHKPTPHLCGINRFDRAALLRRALVAKDHFFTLPSCVFSAIF